MIIEWFHVNENVESISCISRTYFTGTQIGVSDQEAIRM